MVTRALRSMRERCCPEIGRSDQCNREYAHGNRSPPPRPIYIAKEAVERKLVQRSGVMIQTKRWLQFVSALIVAIALNILLGECLQTAVADEPKSVEATINPKRGVFDGCGGFRANLPSCTYRWGEGSTSYVANNCSFSVWLKWDIRGCPDPDAFEIPPGQTGSYITECRLHNIWCCASLGRCR